MIEKKEEEIRIEQPTVQLDGGNGSGMAEADLTEEEYDALEKKHPFTYEKDKARERVADKMLDPPPEKLKEFTYTPSGMVLDMCMADTMIFAMKEDREVSLAEYLMTSIDQRMRARDGRLMKDAIILAGDEAKEKEEMAPGGDMNW